MGNNSGCKIVGIRFVKVKMFDGVIRILHEVKHGSRIKRNLISLVMLDDFKFLSQIMVGLR